MREDEENAECIMWNKANVPCLVDQAVDAPEAQAQPVSILCTVRAETKAEFKCVRMNAAR
jgi:hypothetical protein